MRTLAEIWATFDAQVISKEAPAVQHTAMRDAFYAGATAAFALQLEATEPKDEEVCLKNIDQLAAELQGFQDEMAARFAEVITRKGRASA